MSAAATPAPAAAAPPRWTSPLFWSTLLIHVIAGVSAFLALEGHGEDMSHVEALVPIIALVASAIAHRVYANRSARNDVADASKHVNALLAELERLKPTLAKVSAIADPLLHAEDPKAAQRLDEIVKGLRKVEQASTRQETPPAG